MELVNIKYTGNVQSLDQYKDNILIVTDKEGEVYPMTYLPLEGEACHYSFDGSNRENFDCEWKYVYYKDDDSDERNMTLDDVDVESIHVIK